MGDAVEPAMPAAPERDRLRPWITRSPATAALIGACIAAFTATWLDPGGRIFDTFAKIDDRVRAGEIWRLFTASFLHAGFVHLWVNAASLASVGPIVERAYGRPKYVAVFLLGGSAGMAASVLFVPNPSVGASAGVFALLGAIVAHALRVRAGLAPAARRALVVRVLVVAGINLGLGLLIPFVDNAAHVGGLGGGFGIGLLLNPKGTLIDPAMAHGSPRGRASGRSSFGWAHQRWKGLAFLAAPVVAIVLFFGAPGAAGWAFLALVAAWLVAMSARCPRCREFIFWWCVSKLPSKEGLKTALQSEQCPVCRYPEASDLEAPATRSEARGWGIAMVVLIAMGILVAFLIFAMSGEEPAAHGGVRRGAAYSANAEERLVRPGRMILEDGTRMYTSATIRTDARLAVDGVWLANWRE